MRPPTKTSAVIRQLVNPSLPAPGCHRFNETVILSVADKLVESGLAAAGYVHGASCVLLVSSSVPNQAKVEFVRRLLRVIPASCDACFARLAGFATTGSASEQRCVLKRRRRLWRRFFCFLFI
jgi:hypothetical protein